MKPNLILMSHGYMAQETLNSAKMIVGDLINADVVSMNEEDGLSGTKDKLEMMIAAIDPKQDILIIADLKGGTPCNVAMMAMMQRSNIFVLSGLNLAMIIEASTTIYETTEELVQYLATTGKDAVEIIQMLETNLDGDEYEE